MTPPRRLLLLLLIPLILLLGLTLRAVEAVENDATLPSQARPPNVIIVGGSSGMGKAAALEVLRHGGRALLVSRSVTKLQAAQRELQAAVLDDLPHGSNAKHDEMVQTYALDCTDEAAVQHWASTQLEEDTWDGLVVTAAGRAPHGPIVDLPTADARGLLESKLWTAYYTAKYVRPKLRPGGAVVFCAGILNRRPGLNCVPLAMANGALEGLTRTAALEWGGLAGGGIRVNCLSPGFCATERFDHLTPEKRDAMFTNTAASLPLKRIGEPSDMGQAIYYLLTAPFCTGVVLDVDGGHGIRQYANVHQDPMRLPRQPSASSSLPPSS
jgi:NAD(P)-dependent dehydrogenase (short-subunit alcohol dehydrogenase family)